MTNRVDYDFGQPSTKAQMSDSDEEEEEEEDPDLIRVQPEFTLGDGENAEDDPEISLEDGNRRSSEDKCNTLVPDDIETAEEAGQVFVMMEGTFRVSRNTRAQWFLSYLNKTIVWNPEGKTETENSEPLEIISCIPRRPAFPSSETYAPATNQVFRITPNTAVTFLSKSYRLVFALDLTPSMASVSLANGCVTFDELFMALRDCLTAISQPSVIPGTSMPFCPKVFVTVFAHAPFLGTNSAPVIVKGFKLLPETLSNLLTIIHDELIHLENDVVPRLNAELRRHSPTTKDQRKGAKPFATMDMTLANILRKGLLSVQLLPDNSCGHIVVVTDGILDFSGSDVMDSLLSQLRTHTISVSFIRVKYPGPRSIVGSSFGYICNDDLMEFIAKTTTGAYVDFKPSLGELDGSDASTFQTAFFTWSFQKGVDELQAEQTRRSDMPSHDAGGASRIILHFLTRTSIDVSVVGLLSIRLREGFTIKSVNISKAGESHIDIVLSMPWKPEISIEYRIGSAWPAVDGSPVLAEIYVEAPYEFVYDLCCPPQKGSYGPYRLATLKRFKHMVQSLEQTDEFLLHFEQFRSNPAHYTLPDVIRDGMPVFYLPPDDVENPIFSSNDLIDHLDFVNFWRPLSVMDVNLWHKWLHVHRISILLEHDRPLASNIFHVRKLPVVRCSLAMNQLHDLLRKWSSVVLVDNHSYIRFIYSDDAQDGDKTPQSFFIVRMAAKAPCVVLRLAFLGGTSGNVRHKIISELDQMLSSLAVQVKAHSAAEATTVLCCWRFAKPVEKMLIQYKDVPSDVFNSSLSGPASLDKCTQTPFPVANPGAFHALSRFLYCRRCVWMPLSGSSPVLYFDVTGRVLTALARLRLREGFRFASTSGGVYNLTTEIEMMDPSNKTGIIDKDDASEFPPCVVQYIIFPPRFLYNSATEEQEIHEQQYSVMVEMWLEPQYGLAVSKTAATSYYNGLLYKQIPDKIHALDCDLLSAFLTFETLVGVCGLKASRSPPWVYHESVKNLSSTQTLPAEDGTDAISFPFDIPHLLGKCHRTRVMFCSYRRSVMTKNVTASNDLLFRFFTKEVGRLHEREIQLTQTDCLGIMNLLRDGHSVHVLAKPDSRNNSSGVDDSKTSPFAPKGSDSPPVDWRCFVKLISDITLIITLIPASYANLQHINETLDIDEIEGTYANPPSAGSSDSTAVSHGEGDSEPEVFAPSRPTALPVPVYVFSCSFEGLQTTLVERKPVNRTNNVEYDLTKQFNIQYERASKRISECSRSDDMSFGDSGFGNSLRSSSFPLRTNHDTNKLWLLCGTVEDAFAKGFVQGVYRSLHLNYEMDPYDIQVAVDGVCDESPVEIDLTEFLRAICPHFKKSIRRRRASGMTTESRLRTLPTPDSHATIKEQFQTIISTCLKKITTKPDVFFFSPPGFHTGRMESSVLSEETSSDVDECCVEFRVDHSAGSGKNRESVSGLSETAESGRGFFEVDPDSVSLHSDVSVTSVFGSSSDGIPYGDNDDEQDEDELLSPLFVQFFCSVIEVSTKTLLGSHAIQQLPTCLSEILPFVEGDTKRLDLSDIQIRLEILCLSLPDELKHIQAIEERTSMRTISGSSSSKDVRDSDSDISAIHERDGMRSVTEDLPLPPEQADPMKAMLDSLKWNLKDEIAYTLSTGDLRPTEEHLRLVVHHVEGSKKRSTCVSQNLPLRFVYNVEQSFEMFIERFERTTVKGYHFTKENGFYYLIRAKGSPVLQRGRPLFRLSVSDSGEDRGRNRSPSVDSDIINIMHPGGRRSGQQLQGPRRASLPIFSFNREQHGIVNPVNNSDIRAFSRLPVIRDASCTDEDEMCIFEEADGLARMGEVFEYSGQQEIGSSASEEEREHEPGVTGTELPGFWLILKLTSRESNLYFHVREFEIDAEAMKTYSEIIEETIKKLRAIAKIVNQELLLKDLLLTRRCTNLLEPETGEDLWKGVAATVPESFSRVSIVEESEEAVDGSYLEASRHFQPGFFKCNIVHEHEFAVHPRLKTGPGRSGMSRAAQALLSLLNTFAVTNRQNMFVIQESQKDSTGAILYIRLHDKTAHRLTSQISNTEEPVSQQRIGSFGRDLDQLSNSPADSVSRAVSFDDSVFSDAPGSIAGKHTDVIVLSFYGICDVSSEISHELILALQNRLDEAVLEMLIGNLNRNPMLKLNFEDVRFVQPARSEPSEVLEIIFPGEAKSSEQDLVTLFHYTLQNLTAFLHNPKYLEGHAEKRFQFMDTTTKKWLPAEDESSFLYNRPPESGGKGIAFIYVLLNHSHISPALPVDINDALKEMDKLTKVSTVPSGGDLKFLVWEKGTVEQSSLLERLKHAVHHALLDFWLEKHFLPSLKNPLTVTALPVAKTYVLETYLKKCVDCKSPAYSFNSLQLPSRRVVDSIVENMISIINSLSLSLSVSAAACVVLNDTETDVGETLVPNSTAAKELLLPLVRDLKPGSFVRCRILGINQDSGELLEKRGRSISVDASADDKTTKQRSLKRFASRVDHTGMVIGYRERFVFISISDITCQIFWYNFSSDTATTFERTVARLFEWQLERHRFLNSVLQQKCGIFSPMTCFRSRPGSSETPSFATSPMQTDFLIANTNYPPKESLRNLSNPKHQQHTNLFNFDTVMENHFPARFFSDPHNLLIEDPVSYHGKQFQEIRLKKKRANEVRNRLRTLFCVWRLRDRRQQISEDILSLLKSNSRPAHFCASPLLFDPQWRRNLGARFPDRQLLCSSPIQRTHEEDVIPPGSRSRHGSGVPTPSKEKQKIPIVEPPRRTSGPSPDQQWLSQIRDILMQEYVHYLQMQGFSVVFARPPSPQRHVKKSPQGASRGGSGASSPTPASITPASVVPQFTPAKTYLQRCVPGGMILLELFFMEPFFFSRMYAVDLHKFSDDFSGLGNEPDKALLNLQKEVDRLKVAMHMHSFLFDFHLRWITRFLLGKSPFFKPGYHLVSFFDDFANYYQKAPSYSKSCFRTDSLSVPCGSIPPLQLYTYILDKDKQYELKKVPMLSVLPEEENSETYALACINLSCTTNDAFECSYIVYSDSRDVPGSELLLRYYIILTSKNDLCSADYIEERFGSFKTLPPPRRPRASVLDGFRPTNNNVVAPLQEPDSSHSVQSSTENLTAKASLVAAFPSFLYIGYFSRLETELNKIVEDQRFVLENFITKVVRKANSDCVRDTLWQRLVAVKAPQDDERRRPDLPRNREDGNSSFSGRLISDAFKSGPRLTAAEFEDLIAHVFRVPIVMWDPELAVFFQGSSSWLDGLLDTLRMKYWNEQRCLVISSGTVQHLVLICPSVPDVTLYISLKAGEHVADASILSRNQINISELKKKQDVEPKKKDDFAEFMEGFVNACCFHMWKNVLLV